MRNITITLNEAPERFAITESGPFVVFWSTESENEFVVERRKLLEMGNALDRTEAPAPVTIFAELDGGELAGYSRETEDYDGPYLFSIAAFGDSAHITWNGCFGWESGFLSRKDLSALFGELREILSVSEANEQ